MVVMAVNGFASSLSPNIPPVSEHGRLFHGYMKGMYMYPCDEVRLLSRFILARSCAPALLPVKDPADHRAFLLPFSQPEKDRMDIFHKFFQVARDERIHQAPLFPGHGPMRILDLGTGTGIWAIDMAEIPRNLRFRIPQDFESPWALGESSFDLIHLRVGVGSVSSWPELYQRICDHLKPGVGTFEHVEIDLEPRCDDGSLSPESSLVKWWGWLAEATQRVNKPLAYNHWTRAMLERAGFVDIQEEIIQAPLNSWPADPHLRDVGRWYNLGTTEGLEAYSLAPFTRVFKWPLSEVHRIIKDVKRDMNSKRIHAYNNM
ncbi:MAG: hypothetical protein M1837_003805 [Sclerophora amabilis]|nr:MAG: hypothetical protein M1837_003805 [Sclerophora amabilis]